MEVEPQFYSTGYVSKGGGRFSPPQSLMCPLMDVRCASKPRCPFPLWFFSFDCGMRCVSFEILVRSPHIKTPPPGFNRKSARPFPFCPSPQIPISDPKSSLVPFRLDLPLSRVPVFEIPHAIIHVLQLGPRRPAPKLLAATVPASATSPAKSRSRDPAKSVPRFDSRSADDSWTDP